MLIVHYDPLYQKTAGTNLFIGDPVVSEGEDLDAMDITEFPTT